MKIDTCNENEQFDVETRLAAERRRPYLDRQDVSLMAKILREGSPEIAVRIRNLSAGGFMAECLRPPPSGTKVVLSLPGAGYIPAEVRWNTSFRMGGLFEVELGSRELGLAAAEPPATIRSTAAEA